MGISQSRSSRLSTFERPAPGTAFMKELLLMGVSVGLSAWALRYLMSQLDPHRAGKERGKEAITALKRQFPDRPIWKPTEYELTLLGMECVVHPRQISESMEDIGGLDDIIEGLTDQIILPLQLPKVFNGPFTSAPKGVLLYGPPGTGKTMLAKALARESKACFISLKPSTLLDKYLGVTNKLVAAVWRLATQLQPSIIYIDEADAMFATRSESGHEALAQLKTEFMQLWDGLETRQDARVVVLAATNMLHALDPAIRRRFTAAYEIPRPNGASRLAILNTMLKKHNAAEGSVAVEATLLNLNPSTGAGQEMIELTKDYTGSDLANLCKHALQAPLREWAGLLRSRAIELDRSMEEVDAATLPACRHASLEDFRTAHRLNPPCNIQAQSDGTGLQVTARHRPQQNAIVAQALAAVLREYFGQEVTVRNADDDDHDDNHQGPDSNSSPQAHGRMRSNHPRLDAANPRQANGTSGSSNPASSSPNSNGGRRSLDGSGSSSGHASAAA
ncbi:hypothetical protein WJX74_003055 [Apatococcus lobatus]|uniref:AAA+ ATPase domain-containing protein n=1 Tax=Apatococcus lobatus TaxID=904363 RepID=A0AAW1RZM7_9CHLO